MTFRFASRCAALPLEIACRRSMTVAQGAVSAYACSCRPSRAMLAAWDATPRRAAGARRWSAAACCIHF